MNRLHSKSILFLIICFFTFSGIAQNQKEEILFTVAGQPVSKSEFLYVYQKNNPNKKNDFSRESLQEYLTLYTNFKLKVMEARAMQVDTSSKVREELQKYGDQLIKSNFDKEVMDAAIQMHYDRMSKERKVRHIMMEIKADGKGSDSLEVYQKMKTALERLNNGEDFNKVCNEATTDLSGKENGGLVGWITGYSIPDANFEDAAYNTPIGKYSGIVRSKYGYHIVKVEAERPASGQVHVSHILLKPKMVNNVPDFDALKLKADSIYTSVKNGSVKFEDAVKRLSDDPQTKQKEGVLEWFGVGKMVGPFEEAAFGLKNINDISEPVKTQFGYHIIKLLEKKPAATLEESKADIKSRIERSDEYKKLKENFVANAKKKYGFTEFYENKNELFAKLDSTFINNNWKMQKAGGMNKPVFTIGTFTFTQKDLASYIEINQKTNREKDFAVKYDKLYKQALEQYITEYDLSTRNEDFKRLMQEYRDGIPLFALLEQKVWSAAAKDSVGLEKYYQEHKDVYMWDERVQATIYSCKDEETAKEVRKLVAKNTIDSLIIAKFIVDSIETVSIEHNLFLAGQNSNVDKLNKKIGMGENILGADGSILFVEIEKNVPSQPKTLKEARGYVISNYQDYLEQQWIVELRQKYPIKIDDKIFNSMIK